VQQQRGAQVSYRLHRKLILEAIDELQRGASAQINLWKYIHDDPTKAALYASGVLCTPRLTMLWLYAFEYQPTLGWLSAERGDHQGSHALESGQRIQDVSKPGLLHLLLQHLLPAPLWASRWRFWLGWLLWPALLVCFVLRCPLLGEGPSRAKYCTA
jgi:hypothetical protein